MGDVVTTLRMNDSASAVLQRVAQEARNTAAAMNSAGRAMDQAFRSSAPDAFAGRAESAFDNAENGAESLGDAINSIFESANVDVGFADDLSSGFEDAAQAANELADAAEEAGESADEVSQSARQMQENFEQSSNSTERARDALGRFTSSSRTAGESADETGESFESMQGKTISLSGALKTLIGAIAGAKIIGEIKDFAMDSIELGKDFTSMMSEVQAISGASDSQLAQLETTAREYGATTVFSASEAAEALKYMSLAGWDANQSSSALGGVLNLAAASGMGLGQASDMVTDYLSAFGMQASDAAYMADMLSYAQSHSNTTAEALGEAYKNSAANLNAAGQDIQTVTAMLEGMANQGYKGTEAGTAMSAIMRDITNSMEKGAIKIGKTSVAVADAENNYRDLTDILTDVFAATEGMGDTQRAVALASTFTADSTKGLNLIFNEGIDKIAGYEEELRNCTGTAETMADTMNDNLTGDMANMNSAFEEMKLQVFESLEGPLRELVQYTTSDIIPALTDWVPEAFGGIASGVQKMGETLQPLIEMVLKNPKAVGSAFASIGAGFAAMKVTKGIGNLIGGNGGLSGALKKLAVDIFGNPWAAGAAAVTAAVVGIGLAIKQWNDMQVEKSLADHFGDVELSAEQIREFSGKVINAEYLVNIDAALGEFENADNFAEEAEAALRENDALEWKCAVGIELTPDDKETYANNIDTFVQSRLDELESRTYAAELTVSTMLKSPAGESLAENISKWAAEDMQGVSQLSAQLTNLVEEALKDGIIDVNEQAAINELQTKINSILSGWKAAEAEAEMDLITQKYGRLSGKDLTSETFTSIVEELGEQRTAAAEALEADSVEFYGVINGLVNSGRLTEGQGKSYKNQFAKAVRNEEAGSLVNSLDFENNTLTDTYGEKLQENKGAIEEKTARFLEDANRNLEEQDYGSLANTLQSAYNSAMTKTGLFSNKDQKALLSLYESMKPDVTAMGDLIDEYRNAGQAVPEDVMAAFNEAMQIGAAAGDTDAAWAAFARSLVSDPASQALEEAILDGTANVPEELLTAVERATAKTTDEPVTVDSMTAELENLEFDQEKADELLEKSKEGLETTEEVNVKTQAGEVDESGADQIGEAAEEEAQSAVGEEINTETKVNEKLTAGDTDTSGLSGGGGEEVESGTVTQETVVNEKFTKGTEDYSQVTGAAEQEFSTQTIDSTATVNVAAEVGSTNFAEVSGSLASQFGSAVQSAFNRTFSASTKVSITVDYSIANPSKTITFSGGGSGTAVVEAHASGGYFTTPHYGLVAEAGPEYIIPDDGSANAIGLWQQAGESLGMLDAPITTTPAMPEKADAGGGGSEKGSSREININVNGNGNLRFGGGGMTKDSVVAILMENIRDAIINIVEQEILEEGDMAYEY